MKRLAFVPGAALTACIALAACSGGEKESFGNVDHDKDGKIIYEEAFFVFPDLTEDKFAVYDADKDGSLNLTEYAALYAAATAEAKEPPMAEASKGESVDAGAAAPKATPPGAVPPADSPEPAQTAKAAPAAANPAGAPPITNEDLISVTIVNTPQDAANGAPASRPATSPKPTESPSASTPPPAASQPPSSTAQPAQAPQATESPRKYVVAKGDILIKIAQKFNVTVDDVIKANPGLNPDAIREGQELVIP